MSNVSSKAWLEQTTLASETNYYCSTEFYFIYYFAAVFSRNVNVYITKSTRFWSRRYVFLDLHCHVIIHKVTILRKAQFPPNALIWSLRRAELTHYETSNEFCTATRQLFINFTQNCYNICIHRVLWCFVRVRTVWFLE